MLDDALKKAETNVANISDKILFLTQEKTELACQLKQLLQTSVELAVQGKIMWFNRHRF